jgi:DNA-binding MarR family transcriptional regulator
LTEGELGSRVHLDSGTLAPLLKRLEKQGFVNRTRPENNERKLCLTLTEEGKALRERAKGIPCTMEENRLLLELQPGLTLCFVRGDRAAEPAVEESLSWYGWWEVYDSQGQMPDSWRDCCAELRPGDFGPELRLWDEDGSREEPMAVMQMEWDGSRFVSGSGFFLLTAVGENWVLDPAASPLEWQGSYRQGEEAFSYRILLRPWGQEWSVDQRLPFRYNDWYLPLIGSGEPMPERIG